MVKAGKYSTKTSNNQQIIDFNAIVLCKNALYLCFVFREKQGRFSIKETT